MAEQVLMLALSPTMENGGIGKWLVEEGGDVGVGDVLCEVETDKTTMELESPAEGTLLKIVCAEGSEAEVGDLIAVVGEPGEDVSALCQAPAVAQAGGSDGAAAAPPAAAASATRQSHPPERAAGERSIRSSPLARRIAAQAGLDVAAVTGTGPRGRIVKRDVEEALTARAAPAEPAQQQPRVAAATDEVVPLTRKRRTIAARLAESKFAAPHFYVKIDAAMGDLMDARRRINEAGPGKLSLNAFLIKLVAEALKKHPRINASWQDNGIRLFGQVDVALAVAQPDGLITPIVRDCAAKGIRDIDQDLGVLIEKARAGALQPDEYAGATFTISNLGSFGIPEFTAIINPPGVAILALGAIERRPVVADDGSIKAESRMTMTLSCDHRAIDGVVAAAFLNDLKAMIEHPVTALL